MTGVWLLASEVLTQDGDYPVLFSFCSTIIRVSDWKAMLTCYCQRLLLSGGEKSHVEFIHPTQDTTETEKHTRCCRHPPCQDLKETVSVKFVFKEINL